MVEPTEEKHHTEEAPMEAHDLQLAYRTLDEQGRPEPKEARGTLQPLLYSSVSDAPPSTFWLRPKGETLGGSYLGEPEL